MVASASDAWSPSPQRVPERVVSQGQSSEAYFLKSGRQREDARRLGDISRRQRLFHANCYTMPAAGNGSRPAHALIAMWKARVTEPPRSSYRYHARSGVQYGVFPKAYGHGTRWASLVAAALVRRRRPAPQRPCHEAVKSNDAARVRACLNSGADAQFRDPWRPASARRCLERVPRNIVELLLDTTLT